MSKAIKIGTADDPKKRLSMLQVGSPNRLLILAMVPGDSRKERQFHRRFSGLRIRGEWFRATEELIQFAKDLFTKEMSEFLDLVKLEPELMDLYEEAISHQGTTNKKFCANAVWYGYGEFKHCGIKGRLTELIGWYRIGGSHPILSTQMSWHVAYKTIYGALPDCRKGCTCQSVLEACLDLDEGTLS